MAVFVASGTAVFVGPGTEVFVGTVVEPGSGVFVAGTVVLVGVAVLAGG